MKNCVRLLAFLAVVLVSSSLEAQTCQAVLPTVEPTTVAIEPLPGAEPGAQPADIGLLVESPSNRSHCTFCNPHGYAVCQTTDGTTCTSAGASKRCIVAPECYCEWGRCFCDGETMTWNCIW